MSTIGRRLYGILFPPAPAPAPAEEEWIESDESYRRRIRAHVQAIGIKVLLADSERLNRMGDRLGLPRGRQTADAAPRRRPF